MAESEWIHFIRPLWLWALPLVAAVPWLWRYLRRPSGDWARVCDPHLLRWLSVRQGEAQSNRGKYLLSGTALLIAILALAGPSWEKLPDQSYSASGARVIALDLSLSMLANDLKPNRLTQARYRLADLLDQTVEGQVGLVSYAGDAYVVCPLTSDMNTIANLLPALQPDIVPVAGSRADLAMEMAGELLKRAGLGSGEVLLVTDSVDSRAAAKARELYDSGIVTSVLAVGTPDGAPIPSGSGFINDRRGNVVISRLDRQALRKLADIGGGRYTELSSQGEGVELWRDGDGSEFSLRDDAMGERWKDLGPWLVLLLLPIAVFGFRQGLLFSIAVVLIPASVFSPAAQADWWDDLWLRKDQQAWSALQNDDAPAAASLAKDPALAGEAWYRSDEFVNATEAWMRAGAADQAENPADLSFNRGNAMAHAGELEGALEAYDEALAITPGMEDAIFNRVLVEKMKQEQEQQQQQDGESQDGESSDDQEQSEDSEQSDEEGDQDEESQEQEGEDESQAEGENAQSQEEQIDYQEAWSEEDAQAMEQWLNRIPDDPGGLLRRKFRNEHQRRGAPEDESEVW